MTSRRIQYLIFSLELASFPVSLGILSFLSAKQEWRSFWTIALLASVCFVVLKLLRLRPIVAKFKQVEAREFALTRRLDEYGISEVYNMQIPKQQDDRNSATREIIRNGQVFSLVSLTAASYIDATVHRHWDHLKKKLDDGAAFRLLLLNPFCAEKEVRDRLNCASPRFDSKLDLNLIFDIYNRYPNATVRFTSNNIYCALFFSDDQMIYDPYHLGKIGDRIENNFVAFRVINKRDVQLGHSYYMILRQHFEYLWSTALGVEAFTRKYQKQLLSMPYVSTVLNSRYSIDENEDLRGG
jgi:hypothetical protein